MRKFDLSLRSSRSSYFATFRHQITILSKTDALDEEKWLNMLGTFVKDWFRYESHFVHGRDSLVDILKERGLLSESDAVQPLVRSSLMAVNIHITIIELNALHTKRQNLFQELDAVIHLLMEAKHWGLRKSRNATSLNSRFKSLDTLKVKIISVTFRRVIRTNHKKASKIWRHENIQLGGCQS